MTKIRDPIAEGQDLQRTIIERASSQECLEMCYRLQACLSDYQNGRREALVEAADLIAQTLCPIPELREAICGAFQRTLSWEERSLDDALGLSNERKGIQAPAKLRENQLGLSVFFAVHNAHMDGAALGDALFDAIAQDFPVSGGTVKNYYESTRSFFIEKKFWPESAFHPTER